jgi:hypothetical protein
MSTLSLAVPAAGPVLPPLPWRRMIWVTWRQHRGLLVSLTAVLAVVSLFLLIAGLKVHHDYTALLNCHPAGSTACGAANTTFNDTDWTMGNTILILMNFAPALLGAFSGPAVLARELETGTFRYAWTQGIGRLRWTIAKLILLAVAVTILAWAFSQLFSWFFDPFLSYEGMNVLAATVFTTRGIAFAAWTLAAFASGAFLGMLLRRIIPAMAATLGAYLGLNLLAWLILRKDYPVAAVTSDSGLVTGQSTPNSPWVLATWWTGPGAKPANQSVVSQVQALFPDNGAPRVTGTQAQAFARHGITQWWRYIPVSRFWPMQLIEAGWLLVLSALLIAATVWLVRRRAA